jgi:hypothetical protein
MIVSLEKLKDTNEVIGRRKSKKDRYYKGPKKKDKRANNDLSKHHTEN